MSKWNSVLILASLTLSQAVFASANFDINPLGALPTSVASGQTVSALYTVMNKTGTARNGYSVEGLPTTVSQNPAMGRCTKPINLAPYASCVLQLDITGPVNSNFALCKGTSCTTASTPLAVSQSSSNNTNNIAKYAYLGISNYGVQVCPILGSGLIDDANCIDAGGNLNAISEETSGITISPDGTHAYINSSSPSDTVYSCTINPADGTFVGNCVATVIATPAGYEGYYGQIAVNHSNTYAYIASYNSSQSSYGVITCPISGNVISANCVQSITGLPYVPVGLSINAADNTLYLGGYDDSSIFRVCSVSGTTISGCVNKLGGGAITFSISATKAILNPAGTILYVADYGNTKMYACDPTYNATPYFNNCVDAGYIGHYDWGFTINKLGTMLYAASYGTTNSACPINNNGSIGTCIDYVSTGTVVDIALGY